MSEKQNWNWEEKQNECCFECLKRKKKIKREKRTHYFCMSKKLQLNWPMSVSGHNIWFFAYQRSVTAQHLRWIYVSCRSCEWFKVPSWALGFPVWEDNGNDTVWRYASESCHPLVALFQVSLQERKVSHQLCVVVAFLVRTVFSPDLSRLCFALMWADCVLPWFEHTLFCPDLNLH